MDVVDVNVLIYAHRDEASEYERFRAWLRGLLNGEKPFGMAEQALNSFVRIVTTAKMYKPPLRPSTLDEAFAFTEAILGSPRCVRLRPSARHWAIFESLCRATNARGKLVTDAWLAALALEHGCDFITIDADFAKFPGLRWRGPFDERARINPDPPRAS